MKTASLRPCGLLTFLFVLGVLLCVPVKGEIRYYNDQSFSIPMYGGGKSINFDWIAQSRVGFTAGTLRAIRNTFGSPCDLSYYVTLSSNAEILCQSNQAAVIPEGTLLDGETVSWTNWITIQGDRSNVEQSYQMTCQAVWSNSPSSTLATVSFKPYSGIIRWMWYGSGDTDGTDLGVDINPADLQGYLGVCFHAADGPHYGWIRIQLPAGNASVFGPVILDWAYETIPNSPILAGQISEVVQFYANFKGANEIPSNPIFFENDNIFNLVRYVDGWKLSYNLSVSGSDSDSGNIFQPVSAGIYGPATPFEISKNLVANLGDYSTDDFGYMIYNGQISLNDQQLTELQTGQFYVNFLSAEYPDGELRGQIFPGTPMQFLAVLNGQNETPPNNSTNQTMAQFSLGYGDYLFYSGPILCPLFSANPDFTCTALDILGPQSGSLSTNLVANLGITYCEYAQPAVVPVEPGFPGLDPDEHFVTLTDQEISWLKQGKLFLNICTPSFPNGEIGGPIKPSRLPWGEAVAP